MGDDGFRKHPIGLGPYKFVSYTPGIELVMEAVEGYWRKVPHVKRLVFKTVPDPATRLAMLKKGEVDVAYDLEGDLGEELKRVISENFDKSASTSGSFSPFIKARSIARPDTPNTSLATEPNLMLASSRTF